MVDWRVFLSSIGPHLGHVTFGDTDRETRGGSVFTREGENWEGEAGRPRRRVKGRMYLDGGGRKG